MQRPALKEFLRVYKREGEDAVHIGVGPDKVAIDEPTREMEDFLRALDGTRTEDELAARFPDAREWLADLNAAGVLEDRAAGPGPDDPLVRRWSRQINYLRLYERPGWSGLDAQRKLAASRVVVVGSGAGGTTLLRLLNSVGIGTLEAVDFDTFALDNLPTHSTLDEEDVGSPKVEALRRHLFRQNSSLTYRGHQRRVESAEDLARLLEGADFFCSAFDRPRLDAARWSNEAAFMTGVPFTSIGATDKGARVGPIVVPGRSTCLECVGIYDQRYLRAEEHAALMGTTVAMLAGIMVGEIVKIITGSAPSRLVGRSLYINTETLEFTFTEHLPRPGCRCQVSSPAGVTTAAAGD